MTQSDFGCYDMFTLIDIVVADLTRRDPVKRAAHIDLVVDTRGEY